MKPSEIETGKTYWSDEFWATFQVVCIADQQVKYIRVDEDGRHTGGSNTKRQFAGMMTEEIGHQ